jgi:glycosyltransferase involved in cell wall biosynthesis
MIEIVYVQLFRLPSPTAHAIQIVSTARALAQQGVRGTVAPRTVPEYLAHADIVVIPAGDESRSRRYTSPLKLFEAMASGVPIVAAPVPSLSSVLKHGRTAFLAASPAPPALARAIEQTLASPTRALVTARTAMHAAASYGWNRRARRILHFLERLPA